MVSRETRRSYVARIAIGVAVFGSFACTYDFDQFGAPANATSSSGATSASAGGAGGERLDGTGGARPSSSTPLGGFTATSTVGLSTGGGIAAGSAGAAGAGGALRCQGVPYGGICWYLGANGANCQEACIGHGQVAAALASFVGTAVQGGSLMECATLLGLLGVSTAPESGTRTDGRGLGCHLYQGQYPWWLSTPSFSATASMFNAQLVCGCTE